MNPVLTKQKITLIIAAFVALIIAITIVTLMPKTQITLAIAPLDAQLKIDNGSLKDVKNGQKINITPGKHTFTLSRDQFTSYTTSLIVEKGKSTELLIALVATSDAGQTLLSSDEAQAIVQRFNGNKMTNASETLTDKYPLVKALPIEARLYRIYPCNSLIHPNDTTVTAVCVDSNIDTATIKPYVEKDIESRGYTPSDYEIIYTTDLSTGD